SGGAEGVLLAQAGKFGGWSLYLKEGKPAFTYNWLGIDKYTVESTDAVAAGPATIKFNFVYDGGGPGKGGSATITVDGKTVAEGRIEKTQGFFFSADEGADVGMDLATPVTEYKGSNKFTGKIDEVVVDTKPLSAAETIEHQKAQQTGALKRAIAD
ncbi:MAG: LamG domain-containing protein, partial [Cyanobacteria bacterium]|nr:LamG domain-containing protein [Cyanobacteriota bacterium]